MLSKMVFLCGTISCAVCTSETISVFLLENLHVSLNYATFSIRTVSVVSMHIKVCELNCHILN